jgi:glyoxylase-like metal-dependent hydrolase (beta-lactamase superfamily II)
VDSLLTDCKRVADCRVLPTPGHGKHAVTLVVEINNQRVGFCGDLVYLEGRLWNWFDCDWDYGLQTGHRELRQSALRLKQEHCDLLCPTHGDLIYNPRVSLKRLIERLDVVLADDKPISSKPINFDEKESPATGFRQILPCLHQWRDGNCAVIISETGNALMVDDGLCYWKSLSRRAAHHRSVIKDLKQSLGIRKIEIVIPTHYHGDHTENIPELVAMEGSEVVCLDTVADPIEHPERYRLAAMLPWYGTTHDRVRVSRKLSDGERLRWHEFEVNIFHLGGQTRHALGVAVNIWNVQTLFVGDAFDLRFPLCNPILCFNDADPSTVGWPYAIKRMLQWKPDLLVCGHGCAVRSPIHLLRRCQDGWRRRLRAFAQLNARKELRRFFDPFF